MKIAVLNSHKHTVTGVNKIIDKFVEDTKCYRKVIQYLEKSGNEIVDLTPENTNIIERYLGEGLLRANECGAELFISCYFDTESARCYSIIYSRTSKVAREQAILIAAFIEKLGFINRGPKEDINEVYMVDDIDIPLIIIEPLFNDISKLTM